MGRSAHVLSRGFALVMGAAMACNAMSGVDNLSFGTTCAGDSDCTAPDACSAATCGQDGMCSLTPLPDGEPVVQPAGDCERVSCQGGAVTRVDDEDDADDQNPCTADSCAGGSAVHDPLDGAACPDGGICEDGVCVVPCAEKSFCDDSNPCTSDACDRGLGECVFEPVTPGTPCGGQLACDETGSCSGCTTPETCPGTDETCAQRTCAGGRCGVTYTPADTPVPAQMPGDCLTEVCDGQGATTDTVDDADVPPDDGKLCTAEECNDGMPMTTMVQAGTPCGTLMICDGGGECVSCSWSGRSPPPGGWVLAALASPLLLARRKRRD